MSEAGPRLGAWSVISGGAVLIGVFAAGYGVGAGSGGEARALAVATLALLAEPGVRDAIPQEAGAALDAAQAAAQDGDFDRAARSLPSRITAVDQAPCEPSGRVFAVSAGSLARNCETGMTAAIAAINANRTVGVTIGEKARFGAPGTAFEDTLDRYGSCRLVYINLEADADPLLARMVFDCKER